MEIRINKCLKNTNFPQELLNASDVLGSVEIGQFMNLWQKFKQVASKDDESEDEIKKSFEQFDLNGDGFITKDEITQVKSCKLSRSKSIFWRV